MLLALQFGGQLRKKGVGKAVFLSATQGMWAQVWGFWLVALAGLSRFLGVYGKFMSCSAVTNGSSVKT